LLVTGAAVAAHLVAGKATLAAIASAGAIVHSTRLYHSNRTASDSDSINGGHSQSTGYNEGQETERVGFDRQHVLGAEDDLEGRRGRGRDTGDKRFKRNVPR